MSNTKDIKAEITEVITRIRRKGIVMDGDIDQAAQEILDRIGERIPKKGIIDKKIPLDSWHEGFVIGFNSCIDKLRQALGLKGE